MKKYKLMIIILTLLTCGAMPTKVFAQSAIGSTGNEDEESVPQVLNVTPIDQHLSSSQYNDYNCFVASMFMALNYFGEEITYRELIPIVRGNDRNGLPANSDFVTDVTEGRLLAKGEYTAQLDAVIENELMEYRPVVVAIRDMSLLAENWNSSNGHAVLVYGIYNGRVFYIDPFNGERYAMPTQSFIEASAYPKGSFAVTFEHVN